MIDQRFHTHPKRRKKARMAARRISIIAGIVDRCYKGRKVVNDSQIVAPSKLPSKTSNYQKQKY